MSKKKQYASPKGLKNEELAGHYFNERKKFIKPVRELLGKGFSINRTAEQLGLSSFTVRKVAIENKIYYKTNLANVMEPQPWQVADPSILNKQGWRYCEMFGIKPERMAWLMTCPKGGQPTRL